MGVENSAKMGVIFIFFAFFCLKRFSLFQEFIIKFQYRKGFRIPIPISKTIECIFLSQQTNEVIV